MNELHRCDGRNGLWCAEGGGRGVCLSDVHHLVQKPVSVAQMQFTHAARSPRARQIAGRVVCGSKINISAGISARESVAMEKSFLQLVFEVLCGTTATLVQLLDCRHRTRCTLLRANHSHRSETAVCFVLLPVVCRDGTFKPTPSTVLNPQGEMTPKIWYNVSQSRHDCTCI